MLIYDFMFQVTSKREALEEKSAGARNDYILSLAAANAHQKRYFLVDLKLAMAVSPLIASQLVELELLSLVVQSPRPHRSDWPAVPCGITQLRPYFWSSLFQLSLGLLYLSLWKASTG